MANRQRRRPDVPAVLRNTHDDPVTVRCADVADNGAVDRRPRSPMRCNAMQCGRHDRRSSGRATQGEPGHALPAATPADRRRARQAQRKRGRKREARTRRGRDRGGKENAHPAPRATRNRHGQTGSGGSRDPHGGHSPPRLIAASLRRQTSPAGRRVGGIGASSSASRKPLLHQCTSCLRISSSSAVWRRTRSSSGIVSAAWIARAVPWMS